MGVPEGARLRSILLLPRAPRLASSKLGMIKMQIAGRFSLVKLRFGFYLVRTSVVVMLIWTFATVAVVSQERSVPLQNQVSDPEAFEVVSIKPMNAGGGARGAGAPCGGIPQLDNDRFVVTSVNVYALIGLAYGKGDCPFVVKSDLISGGPGWIRTDRFEIQALIPKGTSSYTWQQLRTGKAPKLQMMIRALLAERFKLVLHSEARMVPVYEMTTASSGYKLKPLTEGSCQLYSAPPPQKPSCGRIFLKYGPFSAVRNGASFEEFARVLTSTLDRPVIDKTGITGIFEIYMTFALDDSIYLPIPRPPEPGEPNLAPSIFTAIQEQLGLKLDATRGPIEVLIVDRIERPAN